ncbi:hypothetical protein B0H16DRAFT_1520825 [Mycena metata]|uniref:Uncharacterized protein n=1 Tax=Mycena metata TaxID=1033252 RepID=A0AAD7JNB0_9AGAR|nr:hypothetical protein B0H16DRAFT_1520825 [Mycena metata]
MDFVPSSQPWQDGDDDLGFLTHPSARLGAEDYGPPLHCALSPTSPLRRGTSAAGGDGEVEIVGSSQPFEDGEAYLCSPTSIASEGALHRRHGGTPTLYGAIPDLPVADTRICRGARLVRRVPPTDLCPSPIPQSPVPRCFNLVRRVTPGPSKKAADMERKRQRARDEAARIVRKLRNLAAVTIRLRRKHRELRAFAVAGDLDNKENVP